MSSPSRSHAWNDINVRPRSGDLMAVGRAASVQFDGRNAMTFRVIRVHDWPTYHGWAWLDGNGNGTDVERRSIFVQPSGLRPTLPKGRWAP